MNLDFYVFEFDFDLDMALNLDFYVFDLDFSVFDLDLDLCFDLELGNLGMRKFLIRRGHKLGNYFGFESPLFWLLKMVCVCSISNKWSLFMEMICYHNFNGL